LRNHQDAAIASGCGIDMAPDPQSDGERDVELRRARAIGGDGDFANRLFAVAAAARIASRAGDKRDAEAGVGDAADAPGDAGEIGEADDGSQQQGIGLRFGCSLRALEISRELPRQLDGLANEALQEACVAGLGCG
jgi:hypothetical protein